MKQNRVKSPVLWGAFAGLILLIMQYFGFEAEIATGSEIAGIIVKLVCVAAAGFGIVNNPTDKSSF